MRPVAPPHLPDLADDTGWTWGAIGASLGTHLLLMVVAFGLSRRDAEPPSRRAAEPTPVTRYVELPPLPPTPAPVTLPQPTSRPADQPPADQPPPDRVPRPQVTRGPDVPEEVTIERDPPPDEAPPGEAPPAAAPEPPRAEPPSRRAAEAPTEVALLPIESEAQRLFGAPRVGSDRMDGPSIERRWATEVTEDRENDCRPRPRRALLPGEKPTMGHVEGRVYREGTSTPLAGAFLQIIGTSYSTFADDDGWYRLAFDQSLVDECRTQYVQVTKDGFRPRRLILALGARTSNDVRMRRY
ncbi:MAG TPA: hypothetical protein VFS94_05455 [Gemmatimonadales bacterium]|nr:hypothetical protein [Gemmatimonadales bacterium]